MMAESTTTNSSDKPVTKGEFRDVMYAVLALLGLNIVIVIVGVVLGITIKGEVDDIQAELAQIMPYLEAQSGAGDVATSATKPSGP